MAKRKRISSPARKTGPALKVRSSGVHGRGVYAGEFIPKGTRIIEYTGQRVPDEESPNEDDNPHTFIFGLGNGQVINADIGGNEARWINHCCDPNCEAIEKNDRIFIHAMRDIKPGEELCYDYSLEIEEPVTRKSKKLYECFCGSPECRGTMLEL